MHEYAQMSKLKDTKTHEQSTEKIAEQKLYDGDPQSMNRHKRIYIRGLSKKFAETHVILLKITAPLSEIPILRRFGLSGLGPCRDQHPVQDDIHKNETAVCTSDQGHAIGGH